MKSHANEKEVKEIKYMSVQKRREELGRLRNIGIYKYNQSIAGSDAEFQCRRRDRRRQGNLLPHCISCKQFLSRVHFPAHKCLEPVSERKQSIMTTLQLPHSAAYEQNILAQLQNDPVGESIRKDQTIIQLGFEEYQYLGDSLRATQLNLRVCSYLRTLASLVMHAKEECYLQKGYSFETGDFFTRDHLRFIEIAIEKLNAETKSVHKKKAYGCVLKSAEAIRSLYLANGEDDKALEVSKFETCLNSRWKYIFRAAEVVAQRRMECSRLPANLPCIEDLQTIRKQI